MEDFNLENHNPERIIVAGDWHRHFKATFAQKVVRYAAYEGIDTILHVGDFGYKFGIRGNDAYEFEKPLHRALQAASVRLFWVDGNHDNHPYLRGLQGLTSGFKQTGARGNIYYAPRGLRWEWSGLRFGALGGARSINGSRLKEGISLFTDLEQVTKADVELLGNEPLDVLVTHDIPEGTPVKSAFGFVEKNQTRDLVLEAVQNTQAGRIFSGHWHMRKNYILHHGTGMTYGSILDKEYSPGNIMVYNLKTNEIEDTPANWYELG